jgi:hypothetical protein
VSYMFQHGHSVKKASIRVGYCKALSQHHTAYVSFRFLRAYEVQTASKRGCPSVTRQYGGVICYKSLLQIPPYRALLDGPPGLRQHCMCFQSNDDCARVLVRIRSDLNEGVGARTGYYAIPETSEHLPTMACLPDDKAQALPRLPIPRISDVISGIERWRSESRERIAAAQCVAESLLLHVSQAFSAPASMKGPKVSSGMAIGYASIFGFLNRGDRGPGGPRGTVSADLLGRPNDRRSPLKMQSPEECVITGHSFRIEPLNVSVFN